MSRGSVLHWLQSLDSSFLAEETTQHGKLVPPEHRPVVREIVLRSRKVTARMHPSQRRGGRGRGHSKYTEVDQAASGSHSSHTDSPTKRPHTPDPNDAQREAVSEAATESDFHSNTRLSTVTRITSASRVSARASLTPTKSPSKSSTKRIGDLRTAKPPIKTEAATEAPQYVQALLNGFRLIQRCRGILPRILKTELDRLDCFEYDDTFFDNGAEGDRAHDMGTFQRLLSLRHAARRCQESGKPEPSWGEEIFRPMLELAAELENRSSHRLVQVENVTTTQIYPKSLVPVSLQDLAFGSKRVDYCIYLSQSNSEETNTLDTLASRNVDINEYGINQAGSAQYVKWLPQLATIECKKDSGGTDGTIQLGIWMAALRTALEGLLKPKERNNPQSSQVGVKPMPCVRIDGLHWTMYWCCIGERGGTMLYGPNSLGSTEDMLGMYKVLLALREIVRYGRDEYWPWFREAVLWDSIEQNS